MSDFFINLPLRFGPAEYFVLLLLFCYIPIAFSRQSMLRSFGAMLLGAALGLVGTDANTDLLRFTLEYKELKDGIPIQCVVLGFVLIPWLIRAQAESWFPLPARFSSASSSTKRAVLLTWRMFLSFLVLNWLLDILDVYGDFGIYVYLAALLAIFGYFFYRVGIPWLPLYFSFICSPMLEENLRRSLLLARGDMLKVASRPITATVICILLVLLISSAAFRIYRSRKSKLA